MSWAFGLCFTRAPVERHAFQDKVNTVKIDADGDGKETGKKYGVGGFPSASIFLLVQRGSTAPTLCVTIALTWFPDGVDSETERYEVVAT